ncbi:MAG: hypothetical protein ACRCX2_13065 [Paraclostridium sp.]
MREIMNMYRQLSNNLDNMGRFNDPMSSTHPCIIKNVYPEKMKADIFIPEFANTLFGISIASNVISNNSFLCVTPERGAEGIVMMSGTHHPVIIAISPMSNSSDFPEMIEGEVLSGNQNCQIRHMHDNNLLLRSNYSKIGISKSGISMNYEDMKMKSLYSEYNKGLIDCNGEKISYSDKVFRPIRKSKANKIHSLTTECINSSISDNLAAIDLFRDLIDDVSVFSETVFLSTESADQSVCELRNKLYNIYMLNNTIIDNFSIGIEEGAEIARDGTIDQSTLYKVCLREGDSEKSFLKFKKDGTVIVKCSDFIIDKGGVVSEHV